MGRIAPAMVTVSGQLPMGTAQSSSWMVVGARLIWSGSFSGLGCPCALPSIARPMAVQDIPIAPANQFFTLHSLKFIMPC